MSRYNYFTVRSVLRRTETLSPELTLGAEVGVFLDGQRIAPSILRSYRGNS